MSFFRFEKFSLFLLKTADLEALGNFYPPPCRIGLMLAVKKKQTIVPKLCGRLVVSSMLPCEEMVITPSEGDVLCFTEQKNRPLPL